MYTTSSAPAQAPALPTYILNKSLFQNGKTKLLTRIAIHSAAAAAAANPGHRVHVARQRHAIVSRVRVLLHHYSDAYTAAAAATAAHFLWQRHHARIVHGIVSLQRLFDRRRCRTHRHHVGVLLLYFCHVLLLHTILHCIRANVWTLCVHTGQCSSQHCARRLAIDDVTATAAAAFHVDHHIARLLLRMTMRMIVGMFDGIVTAGWSAAMVMMATASATALLLILFLQCLHLQSRLVALIIHAGEYHYVQYQ